MKRSRVDFNISVLIRKKLGLGRDTEGKRNG